MLVFDVAIRRYTPPTCTLEIKAKQSLFSRWTGHLSLKEWHFELRFDDPRLPEEEQVTVRGDRAQLELFCDVVRAYVQNLLHQSLALAVPLPSPAKASPVQEGSLSLAGELGRSSPMALLERPPSLPATDSLPVLNRKGMVDHELHLGSLAAGASQSLVKLSASQLFDLATALDEYAEEADNLAALQPFPKRKVILMAASATSILLVAAGIAALAIKRLSPTDQPEGAVASESQSQPPNISDVLPPVPLPPPSVPSPKLPSSLAQQKALPPPPAVKAPSKVPRVVLPQHNPLPPPPSRPSHQQVIAISPQSQGRTANPGPPPPSQRPTSLNLPAPPPLAVRPPAPKPSWEGTNASNSVQPERQESSSELPRLLDTIPQVKEVRHYFQERWQVPKELNQRLEYRLLLNQEGTLDRIIPLGRAAEIYLDRTEMPLLREPFVSPLTSGEKATIRLVLVPNGTVKTFLE